MMTMKHLLSIVFLAFFCSTTLAADITVDGHGGGDFKTVQAAIDSIVPKDSEWTRILIRPGTYTEQLTIDKPRVRLIGLTNNPADVVLTFNLNALSPQKSGHGTVGTTGSSSTFVKTNDFVAQNVTFANSTPPHVAQAVAIKAVGDRLVFDHCRFVGFQDTLYASGGRQLYKDCSIIGAVDFIFGDATAVFDHCTILSVARGHITAANTEPSTKTGYVFLNCTLKADDGVRAGSVDLGRPWQWDRGRNASVSFIDTKMGPQISAAGWNPWSKSNTNPASHARYSEFGSMNLEGQPLDISGRVAWAHQLTAQEAARYTIANVLGGADSWDPNKLLNTSADKAQTASDTSENIAAPKIPDNEFNILDFGAVGDGKTINTGAFTKAIQACAKAGGGTVVIPAGRFLTGPISLTSNLNLHLNKDATIAFVNDIASFPMTSTRAYEDCMTAEHCHDVELTGEGTIDGQGAPWWDKYRKHKGPGPQPSEILPHRPYMVVFNQCKRVRIEGVSFLHSPSFHLVPRDCEDVVIKNIRIHSPANSPNTDGIDPSGKNYLITGCHIDVGDDCIAVKPANHGVFHPSCENFTIENCEFVHGHGMSVGGQTPGGLKNMVVRDCTFDSTDAGIRLKANRGSGGLVEDVTYDNLSMKNVKVEVLINSYYPHVPKDPTQDPGEPANKLTPIWRHIRINNVKAIDGQIAGEIVGLPEMPVEDVVFTNVHLEAQKGMEIAHARGIRFINSTVSVKQGKMLNTFDAQVSGLTNP